LDRSALGPGFVREHIKTSRQQRAISVHEHDDRPWRRRQTGKTEVEGETLSSSRRIPTLDHFRTGHAGNLGSPIRAIVCDDQETVTVGHLPPDAQYGPGNAAFLIVRRHEDCHRRPT
jgi:hypothetical protein